MAVRDILLLGNPGLYEKSGRVEENELEWAADVVDDLHDTLMNFRKTHGAGRAIAAPQIGVMKRILYMHIDRPAVFINPLIDRKSEERMVVWDDCMSFPDLLVKLERRRSCRIVYRDMSWTERRMALEGDLSELLQHEYDHLDGVLAVSRAMDGRSLALKSQRALIRENGNSLNR